MVSTFYETLYEQHLERAAFEIYRYENINGVLERLDPPRTAFIEVYHPKKQTLVRILAKSINANNLWEKFYASEDGVDIDRGSLDNVKEKAEKYANFLITKHKQNYQYIRHDDDINALVIMTGVSALMKSAESRHLEGRFKDVEAHTRLQRILTRREENVALAKGWGHSRKHGEDPNETLKPVFDEFQVRMNNSFFPPYQNALPPLPPGLDQPMAWLNERVKGR